MGVCLKFPFLEMFFSLLGSQCQSTGLFKSSPKMNFGIIILRGMIVETGITFMVLIFTVLITLLCPSLEL